MTTQAELHNRLAPELVKRIVSEPILAGGGPTDVMVVLETVIVATCIAIVQLGGDDKVLDVVIAGARKRLAEIRLAPLKPQGTA
jgi:hypothetical protein